MRIIVIKGLIILLFLFLLETSSNALDVKTHQLINDYIANHNINNFSLDAYLKNQAGIQAGIYEQFNSESLLLSSKRAWEWLRDGGYYEDEPPLTVPYVRSTNHFHNPLALTLNDAGFTGVWNSHVLSGQSAILWSQRAIGTQSPGGYYSWYDVRQYFYTALISKSQSARNNNFAATFRGVGQLMHLVEDMSVPEHARDDGHYTDAYEEYVRDHADLVTSATKAPIFFDMTALGQPSAFGVAAPVPISNLFDTHRYNGTNPNITVNQRDGRIVDNPNIGLAEYTNANFVSPDTLFINFRYPSRATSVVVQDYVISNPVVPGFTVTRQYYKKVADGDIGYRLAGVNYFAVYLATTDPNDPDSAPYKFIPPMDDNVYSDYAQRLLPRAVGYAADLLDYFFRGNITVTLPNSGIYSSTSDSSKGFTNIKLLAVNTSSNGDEMTDGSIELVVKYKLSSSDPFKTGPVPTSTDFYYTVVPEATGRRSISKDMPVLLTFDLSGGNNSIPIWATDLYLQVVYHGKLGNEDGAVAVGFKDISEPTPVDLYNNMDKVCLSGSWYDTGSLAARVAAPVDWDIYIHNINNAYLKIAPSTDQANASPTDYTFAVQTIPANTLYRAYILSDYNYWFNYSIYMPAVKTDPADTYIHTNAIIRGIKSGYAVKNQYDYSEFYKFRGVNMWGASGYIIENAKYPTDTSCSWTDLR